MFIRPAPLLTFAALLSFSALAQSATFDLIACGQRIGKDNYTLSPSKHGYKLLSPQRRTEINFIEMAFVS